MKLLGIDDSPEPVQFSSHISRPSRGDLIVARYEEQGRTSVVSDTLKSLVLEGGT